MLKRSWKYISNALLIGIIVILIIPSWRVSFQGWFQGMFMSEMGFEQTSLLSVPPAVMQWELTTMDRENHPFSEYSGQPLIISFWATWCPPCRAELKELKELKKLWADKVHFVSVSEEKITTIKESGLDKDYDFLYRTDRYPSFFQIQSYPTVCIFNKKQELVYKHEGAGRLNTEKNNHFIKGLVENE